MSRKSRHRNLSLFLLCLPRASMLRFIPLVICFLFFVFCFFPQLCIDWSILYVGSEFLSHFPSLLALVWAKNTPGQSENERGTQSVNDFCQPRPMIESSPSSSTNLSTCRPNVVYYIKPFNWFIRDVKSSVVRSPSQSIEIITESFDTNCNSSVSLWNHHITRHVSSPSVDEQKQKILDQTDTPCSAINIRRPLSILLSVLWRKTPISIARSVYVVSWLLVTSQTPAFMLCFFQTLCAVLLCSGQFVLICRSFLRGVRFAPL